MADKDTDLTAKQVDEENNTTATGNTTATDNNANTASNVTETTTRQKITVPEQFHGTTHKELYDFLQAKMAENQPLSKEELQKLRKRQRAEGIVAGISDAVRSMANLFTTTQYAPDMYNPQYSMSAKAKARFDKEKAERDAADDRFYNYAINYARLQGEDKAREYDIWKTEKNMQMQQQAYDDARKDREEDVAYRNKDFDTRMEQWSKSFEREGQWHEDEVKRIDRQFAESQRQFNVQSSLERQRIGLEAQRLSESIKQGQISFNLGAGRGNVILSTSQLNHQTVGRMFGALPAKIRDSVHGEPIYSTDYAGKKKVEGYEPPSEEAMLIAIGNALGDESNPNMTQKDRDRLCSAIRQVSGQETGKKPKLY